MCLRRDNPGSETKTRLKSPRACSARPAFERIGLCLIQKLKAQTVPGDEIQRVTAGWLCGGMRSVKNPDKIACQCCSFCPGSGVVPGPCGSRKGGLRDSIADFGTMHVPWVTGSSNPFSARVAHILPSNAAVAAAGDRGSTLSSEGGVNNRDPRGIYLLLLLLFDSLVQPLIAVVAIPVGLIGLNQRCGAHCLAEGLNVSWSSSREEQSPATRVWCILRR